VKPRAAHFSFLAKLVGGCGGRAGASARCARRGPDMAGLGPGRTPELPGALEPALIRRAGRVYRPAAQRLLPPWRTSVVHPRLVLAHRGHFPGPGFPRTAARLQFVRQILQLPDDFHHRCVLQRPLPPMLQPCIRRGVVLAKPRPGHRRQGLDRVPVVQLLATDRIALVGQPPQPHRAIPGHQRPGCLAQSPQQRSAFRWRGF